jgi:hypothetical protein
MAEVLNRIPFPSNTAVSMLINVCLVSLYKNSFIFIVVILRYASKSVAPIFLILCCCYCCHCYCDYCYHYYYYVVILPWALLVFVCLQGK